MHIQMQLNNQNDLSKNLFIEVYEDGIEINGNETDNFVARNPGIFTDYRFEKVMEAIDNSDLEVTAIAYQEARMTQEQEGE